METALFLSNQKMFYRTAMLFNKKYDTKVSKESRSRKHKKSIEI